MGYILWGLEIIPRRYSYLVRVYIDKDGTQSLGIEDCAAVNRALDACLLEENVQLEVSTPGLARKFFRADQYNNYIGNKIKIKTNKLINGQRNFVGELVSSDGKSLSIKMDGLVRDFLHGDITTGQLEPDYTNIFKQ